MFGRSVDLQGRRNREAREYKLGHKICQMINISPLDKLKAQKYFKEIKHENQYANKNMFRRPWFPWSFRYVASPNYAIL